MALAALAVFLVSLGVTVGASRTPSNDPTCRGTEYRVLTAAQLPSPWRLISQSYLGPMSYATVEQDTGDATATLGPNPIPQLSVSVTCYGSSAADVMREYHVVPPVDASPIPAPTLGDEALAFELNPETSVFQYFIFVRRGDLVASITGMGQVPAAVLARAWAHRKVLDAPVAITLSRQQRMAPGQPALDAYVHP